LLTLIATLSTPVGARLRAATSDVIATCVGTCAPAAALATATAMDVKKRRRRMRDTALLLSIYDRALCDDPLIYTGGSIHPT
jgi:hypothetical protein